MPSDAGLVLGCTTCDLRVVLEATGEDDVRSGLAGFFVAHDGCDVFVDVSRAAVPLPRPASR